MYLYDGIEKNIYMNELKEKLNQLKWLQQTGIEYYCSEEKDSKISLLKRLKEVSKPIQLETTQKIRSLEITTLPELTKKQATKEPSKNSLDARNLADNAKSLDELRKIIENFEGCDLKNFANKTVFSDGPADAKILLIGEAPGASEDEQGVPFCGESGIMLDRMLESIGLSRTRNAYITNSIFWRPPANRRPTPGEIEICKPFVEKHIALIKPELIILVGGTATTALLGNKQNISDIRENYYEYTNQYLEKPILTTAIFHPAFLLRQPSKKKDTWFDLLKIRDLLEERGVL
jgi:uracil-DNA glycosylase